MPEVSRILRKNRTFRILEFQFFAARQSLKVVSALARSSNFPPEFKVGGVPQFGVNLEAPQTAGSLYAEWRLLIDKMNPEVEIAN